MPSPIVKDRDDMAELNRWNDDRLDDLARRVNEAVALHDEVGKLRSELLIVHGSVDQCHAAVRDVARAQGEAEEHRTEREKQQRDERRADLRWAVGTVIAVLALVIAALGVFLG